MPKLNGIKIELFFSRYSRVKALIGSDQKTSRECEVCNSNNQSAPYQITAPNSYRET